LKKVRSSIFVFVEGKKKEREEGKKGREDLLEPLLSFRRVPVKGPLLISGPER